ncbi:prenylcysteine oxidase-like [Dendronephthya gigantea]|uniref:prenylcysteine oxidase-like n=1 Tax=Dendronephthya gigantea TaxID=151771 RepID=UPI00106987BB|nr:prenylcysteine oxidase-like [Dendronephthya gigantea]
MAYFRYFLRGTFYFFALPAFSLTALQLTRAESPDGNVKKAGKIPRVAIIGSGIGGSSAAHFVREILGEDAQISVFEKSGRVGGRLATVDISGETFESGGSIIHPRNLYMKKFVEYLGLERNTDTDGIFSLYDGKDIVFSTSSWSWLTSLKLLWRYGFSLVKMDQVTKSLLNKFANIYTLQDKGESFHSVPDLLQAMSGNEEFYRLTKITARKYLLEQGLSELLIDELVTAIMRINYGQSTEVNAFTGMVSLAGAESNLWSVKGGNWKVCEGLLNKSSVILNKNTQIIEIIKKSDTKEDGKPLYYLRSVESLINTPFDVVIVALPLDIAQNFIGCSECSNWPMQTELGQFQQTVATFVDGNLNDNTFKKDSSVIGTMEKPEIFFSSIGKQPSVYKGNDSGAEGNVWKVFSRKPLTDDQKHKLFSESKESKEVIWLAYPHYTPPEKFLSFVLDDGVFYVNTIE